MSVNVFADFNITTLECDFQESKHPKFFSPKLSLRIDEKRKKMRLSLLPEHSYHVSFPKISPSYAVSFKHTNVHHTIGLDIDSLYLSYTKDREDFEEVKFAFYSCKII